MDRKNYQDHYFKQAKSQGYRSRSALKLIELNNKFKFIKNGINVLDVGSFPGGWCQVIRKKINNGKILGIDIKKIQEIDGVKLIQGDFLKEDSKKIMQRLRKLSRARRKFYSSRDCLRQHTSRLSRRQSRVSLPCIFV